MSKKFTYEAGDRVPSDRRRRFRVVQVEDGPRVGRGRRQFMRAVGRARLTTGTLRADAMPPDAVDRLHGWTPAWGVRVDRGPAVPRVTAAPIGAGEDVAALLSNFIAG